MSAGKSFRISGGVLKVSTTNGECPQRSVVTKSGCVERRQSFVTEVIADVKAKESALRFALHKGLIIDSRELEIAVNSASVAESQVQGLL